MEGSGRIARARGAEKAIGSKRGAQRSAGGCYKVRTRLAKSDPRRLEHGAAGIMFALMFLIMIAFCAFAADMGSAHVQKVTQQDLLQQTEAVQMRPQQMLEVKNSDQPGRDITLDMAKTLRELGYTGAIDAYFYEPTVAESGLDESQRVYVYGLTLTKDVPATFGMAAFGNDHMTVKDSKWSWANPYAENRTWRPNHSGENGCYHVDAGADAANGTWVPVASMNETQMPGGGDVLRQAVQTVRDGG